ncbi:hypothetical protein TNIN_496891 [Trichonephila inaurata madagascariensis]|uniref:TIL domain-containing protein n=1 Tax=Trichonephila inaurata madagascariensis TaxID=2747483 RepID=A0A8X7CRX0_9ARAC|nr:hypothetical protein TNIN_496891 [Trichonephila inaurata madagascariensis]
MFFLQGSQCPKHQHMESCATACPTTCKNRNGPPQACAAVCFNGCVCDKGYIKKNDKKALVSSQANVQIRLQFLNDIHQKNKELTRQP